MLDGCLLQLVNGSPSGLRANFCIADAFSECYGIHRFVVGHADGALLIYDKTVEAETPLPADSANASSTADGKQSNSEKASKDRDKKADKGKERKNSLPGSSQVADSQAPGGVVMRVTHALDAAGPTNPRARWQFGRAEITGTERMICLRSATAPTEC